jgi:hypothetical protein
MKFEAYIPAIHKQWVKRVINPVLTEDTRGVIAVRDDGSIAGAIIMDSWAPNSCQVHIGAETSLVFKYGLHKEAARYIFKDAGRKIALGLTPSNNMKAVKANKHLGFEEVGRIPDGYSDGVDYIIFRLDRDKCEYLED